MFPIQGEREPFAPNDASSHHLLQILEKKGYEVVLEGHFLMSYNILFRYPDEVVKEMVLSIPPYASLLVQEFLSGKTERPHYRPDQVFLSFCFRIEWLAPKANHPFFQVNPKKCIHCGLCVRTCPQKALYVDESGEVKMKNGCALCMNCVDHCPKEAIRFGLFNSWKVAGFYDYGKILSDSNVPSDTIRQGRKDYYGKFRKYYFNGDEELRKAGMIPKLRSEEGNKRAIEKKE